MERKMWTPGDMLEYIFKSGIKSSWESKDNKSLGKKHAKIVALLKAFDLYVEDQPLFDKDCNKVSGKFTFDITDFYNGNFIEKRNKHEVYTVLKQLAQGKVIRREYKQQMDSAHTFLSKVFRYLVDYRMGLQYTTRALKCGHIMETLILHRAKSVIEQQAEVIDSVLLKIIGDKKAVPESILIQEYGFPAEESMTGGESIEEILASLDD